MLTSIVLLLAQEFQPQPLPDEISSWYTITLGRQHLGYAHTILRKKANGYEFLKKLRIESERSYTESVRAFLDINFRITQLNQTVIYGDASWVIKYDKNENPDNIDVVMPNGVRQRIIATGIPNVELSMDMFVASFVQRGIMGAQGRSFRFSLLFLERNRAYLQEIELKNLGERNKKYLGKETQVLEGSVKKVPQSDNSHMVACHIDKFGRVIGGVMQISTTQQKKTDFLEAFLAVLFPGSQNKVQVELVGSEKEAMSGMTGQQPMLITHNPFNKEAVMTNKKLRELPKTVVKDGVKTGPLTTQDVKLESVRLEQMVGVMRKLDRENKKEELKKLYGEFIDLYRKLLESAKDPQQQSLIRSIKAQAEQVFPGVKGIHLEALSLYGRMNKVIEDYNSVAMRPEDLVKEVEKYQKEIETLSKRTELYGDPLFASVIKVLDDAGILLKKSKNIMELDGVALVLSGILYSEDVKVRNVEFNLNILGTIIKIVRPTQVTQADAYAVINGRLYAKGDFIQRKTEENQQVKWVETKVRVQTIERDRVVVAHEDIDKELRIEQKK